MPEPNGDVRPSAGWFHRLAFALLRPVIAIPLTLAATLITGVIGYRESRLIGISDLGDPFDVAAFRADLEVGPDNALLKYEWAMDRLGDFALPGIRDAQMVPEQWSEVSEEVRDWFEQNSPAFALWKTATEIDSFATGELGDNDEFIRTGLFALTFGGLLQSLRAEADGDLDAAMSWAIASLRCSVHASRCCGESDMCGTLQWLSCQRIVRLFGTPDFKPDRLRHSLEEVRAAIRLRPLPSWHFRRMYLDLIEELRRNPGELIRSESGSEETRLIGVRLFLLNEPERATRILRHLFRNLLEDWDQPLFARPEWSETPRNGLDGHEGWLPTKNLILHFAELDGGASAARIWSKLMVRDTRLLIERTLDDVLLATLAVLTYRASEGMFPASLHELIQAGILDEIPVDRFGETCGPLLYRSSLDTVAVWSVGPNATDDDGLQSTGPTFVLEMTYPDIVLKAAWDPPAKAEIPRRSRKVHINPR